ncbi:DOMON-like domain-containing protein [Brevundimonas sp. Leaf363]|uniref:DOMON-like domain-containing protein n=1 Tax=Brevundimonas sp. Leaf363 TaxID=1736353 RepID=UPI000A6C64C2|nr:DOMON-like domain-containing protein [Brevundimonas sp. Leaf363]
MGETSKTRRTVLALGAASIAFPTLGMAEPAGYRWPMEVDLIPHPTNPPGPIERVSVRLERRGPKLWLRYTIEGRVGEVETPAEAAPDRTDELWKHTCFEVFIQTDGGYREFNLAPSSRWASYRFTGYRQDMADADEIAVIEPLDLAADQIALEAEVELPDPVGLLALSTVIEATDGTITYWALAHPSPEPDFHNPAGFTLSLPAEPA